MIKKRTNKGLSNQRATKKTKLDDEDEETINETTIDEASPIVAPSEANRNSLLSASTKTKKLMPIHDTLIKANREEKESDRNQQLITSTNTNEFDELDEKKKKDVGPTKVSKSVRVTSRMDYQPDICKDYYETGICGYGDNCKFAHVREEHVSSIEHTKRWEKEQQKKLDNESKKDVRGEDDQGLPHACFICRKAFVDPVVTKCGHYFCSSCAIKRYNGGKEPMCACCGANTNGVFNTAHKIIALNKKKK